MNWTSKIGLGTVQFGLPYGISNTIGQTTDLEVSKILDVANKFKLSTLDTASSYGTSEFVVGKYAKNRFDIISKFMPSNTGKTIEIQFETSLNALHSQKLYGYLAHRPIELIANQKDWEVLQHLKSEGKVEKIGFSLNEPKEYFLLLDNGIIPDLVQVPFNYFDTRFKEIMIELKEKGCEIHTRSTFLQGLFFLKKEELSKFFTPFFSTLDYLHLNYKDSLHTALLKYVLKQPYIDKVILGIENANQLVENIEGIKNAPSLLPLNKHFSNELVMPMYWPKK